MGELHMSQQVLLSLLAKELFHSRPTFFGEINWQEVFQESVAQAVQVLAYQSCRGFDLPEAVRCEWETHTKQLISNNLCVDYEHSELHEIMNHAGIPYVIMKGSVSAEYYPDPMRRIMGDVDFLIQKADVETVRLRLQDNGFTAQPANHECELAFHRDASVWELHWQVNGVPGGEIGDTIQSYLADILEKATWTQNENGGYMRPSEFHHGLIMLLHVARHMITGGVGLRHLCDWAVYAARIGDAFPKLFEERLKQVGLWRFAQILTQLSTVYLDCPEQSWQGTVDVAFLSDLMQDIFAGGNFGHKDQHRADASRFLTSRKKGNVNDDSLFKQAMLSANEIVRRHWPSAEKLALLYPIGWVFFGTRYLARMAVGKRPQIPIQALMEDADNRRDIYKQLKLFE